MSQLVEARNVSLYPVDWAAVTQIAKDYGLGSVSASLRYIIRDWQRLKTALELHCPIGQPHTLAIRVPAGEAQPEEV